MLPHLKQINVVCGSLCHVFGNTVIAPYEINIEAPATCAALGTVVDVHCVSLTFTMIF